jgi:signal transduction histidine kinase
LSLLALALVALHLAPFSPFWSWRIVGESARGTPAVHAVVTDDVDAGKDAQLLLNKGASIVGCSFDDPRDGWLTQWQVNLRRPGHLLAFTDLTGDDVDDLLMLTITPDSSRWLDCYDRGSEARGEPQPRWTAGPFLAGLKERRDGRLGMVDVRSVMDADGDGRLELYVFLYPFAPGKLPRSLLALDAASGKLLWYHDFAPVVDIAGLWISPENGERRLIVHSCHAPGNRFHVGDTSDFELLIWALALDGSEVWRSRIPASEGASLLPAVTDFDGDSRPEYVFALRDPNAPAGKPKAALLGLDPADGRVWTIRDDLPFPKSLLARDLNGDGHPELLWLGAEQTLICLDHRFRTLWRAPRRDVEFINAADDLDGDGRIELLGAKGRVKSILSGQTGRILARQAYPSPEVPGAPPDAATAVPDFSLHRIAGHTSIFVQTPEWLGTARLVRNPLHPLLTPGSLLVMALAIVGTLSAARRGHTGLEQDLEAIDYEDRLLGAMAAYQHGGGSQRRLDRIGRLLRNWQEWDRSERARWADIGAEFANYGGRLLAEIMRIAAISRHCALPPGRWRQLAADAQDLATELQLLQGRVAALAVEDEPVAAAAEPTAAATDAALAVRAHAAFERVDESLRLIRRELRRRNNCRILEAVAAYVRQRRLSTDTQGVTITYKVTCPRDVVAHISPVVLDKVLDNLVGNALRAIAHAERREIAITLSATDTTCRIDVRDWGMGLGLPPEEWDRIFERTYTTRQHVRGETPGGAGLHYAREKLAEFEGRIAVLESRPGEGTTFTVSLQLSEVAG